MNILPSRRLQSIGAYAFAEVDNAVEKLKARGITPTDFGVGDPTAPTPEIVREATKAGADARATAGYPSYIGAPEFRRSCAEWMKRRFGVEMGPDTEIASTVGSKEAVFNLHEGFINPGDVVVIPSPGYPPYSRGTLFAEGEPWLYPLTAENGFLPDLDAIPQQVRERAKVMWVDYPNSPTGAVAALADLERIADFGREHDILICSDEAYIDLYYTDEAPPSILNVTTEGVLAVFSLSKRSAMTCYRVGWIAGDARAVDIFKKVKTNIDSGTATFVQDGAIAALSDETHVDAFRDEYRKKRDILVAALMAAGLPDCTPQGTIYLWQRVPEGMSSVEFAERLLEPDVAIVTTPGAWISTPVADGSNPGEGYVRFAFVPTIEDTRAAADKLAELKF